MNIFQLKYRFPFHVGIFLMMSCLLLSCNKDEDITAPDAVKPQITFDNGTGVYQVKVAKQLTITPTVSDAVNPHYRWLDNNGKTVGQNLSYTFSSPVAGTFYLTFCVDADNGNAKEDIRIDVLEKLIPAVVLPEEMHVATGKQVVIEPAVENGEDATYCWTLDGKEVGNEATYTFSSDKEGDYKLTLTVTNEDSQADATMILIVSQPRLTVAFAQSETDVFRGRTVCLEPLVTDTTSASITYKWAVNGNIRPDATDSYFYYTSDAAGKSTVTVTVTNGDTSSSASIIVNCLNTTEDDNYRPATAGSDPKKVKVYEFMPAPGQFVREISASTMAKACEEAEQKVNNMNYVSLGSFGGYIIVGFDHSVLNKEGEYDFAIAGNSFDTSSEPGIVWVSQDENGNGLPDDTWYQLRGSETDKPGTRNNYSVTYYKPTVAGMPVMWVDSENNTGTLSLRPAYPAWQEQDSYTLTGTRLQARTELQGITWVNKPFGWGYVDNFGSDRLSDDANQDAGPNYNYFMIENAMYANRQPVVLKYIDFIKVQSAVLSQAGPIGEVSTEVLGFWDYNMK